MAKNSKFIHRAALLCKESYECARDCDFESKITDTQAIWRPPFLVFRGTEKLKDWRTNLQVDSQRTINGLEIHQGFLQAWLSIMPQIRLKKEIFEQEHVVITGHSLGGALALTAAITSLWMPIPSLSVITFGAPRIFKNHEKDIEIPFPYTRVINNNDIVTRVPPRSWGYNHPIAGPMVERVYYNVDGKEENASGWSLFLDRMKGHFDSFGDNIGDHSIERYIDLAEKNIR